MRIRRQMESHFKRVLRTDGVVIASVRAATKEEILEARRMWDAPTNTMENPPAPAPIIPRFDVEMPSTEGVTLLTETPIGICR